MNIELRPEAIDDIAKSADFFNEKSEGWGDHFVSSIARDLFASEGEAGIYATHFGLPCKSSKTFPFAIYHRIKGNFALFHCIFSCRLSPKEHESILKYRRLSQGNSDSVAPE